MPTTLELTEQHQQLLDEMYFADGEELELIKSRLDAIKGTAEQRINFFSSILLECKINTQSRKEQKDRATKRHTTSVNAETRIKTYITELMSEFNIKKVECDECTMTRQHGRETAFIPEDFDYNSLPEQYKTIIPEQIKANKNDLTKALKNGEEIEGVSLLRGNDFVVVR